MSSPSPSPSSLTTSVEPLEGNKVRLKIAVPAQEFEKAIDAAFRKLAREVRMPGFRPGKAPRQLLEARLGTGAAREQALRDALPEYYATAVETEDIDVIAPPEIDITAGEDDGDVEFDAVVEVRPIVEVSGYDSLTVEVASPTVDDEAIDSQIDALRERFADLEDSTNPLTDGDYAQIDIKGSVDDEPVDGLSATDFLYEVGSGSVVEKLDQELRGKKAGDILQFDDAVPGGPDDEPGTTVSFRVLVKDAKKKVLPDADDEWASEVSEFDTIDELRNDARTRLEMYAKVQAQLEARDKVLEASSELVAIEAPEPLVAQEMERRLHDLQHRLEPQGINITQYLQATGQDQEQFIAGLREGCARAVKADLALRAVVAQEGIEATDAEVDAEVARLAERFEEKPAKVRKDLEQ
ncbi:MAG: trigger factor, partial [Acidimicrobiia bacterium]|nr:trigger factor [Acidimicrobiia bacterium]